MKIPAFLYGTHRDVFQASKKRAKQIMQGAALVDPNEAMLDTSSVEGFLVMEGSRGRLAGNHFFLYSLNHIIKPRSVPLDPFLSEPWGLAACMGQDSYHFVYDRVNQENLIRACARFWDELHAVGRRFVVDSPIPDGKLFWSKARTLYYALGQSGLISAQEVIATNPDPDGRVPLLQARALVDRWLKAHEAPN